MHKQLYFIFYYFLWGDLKSVLYKTPRGDVEGLQNKIRIVCANFLRETLRAGTSVTLLILILQKFYLNYAHNKQVIKMFQIQLHLELNYN